MNATHSKKDILIIINPISGNSRTLLTNKIYSYLDKEQFNIYFSFTGGPGDGARMAKKAVEQGAERVIAVGGDGTVNEIAGAMVHTNVAFGIIPNGSGDGLARHLKIDGSVEHAVKIINQGNTIDMDYCTANDIKFFCTFGMGFDALVSYAFSKAAHRGFATYVEKILKEYINYKPEEYVIECNGETITSKSFLITCANASQWGNNAVIAPCASVTDGLIDVMTMEPFSIIDAAPLAFQLFTKSIDKSHNIKMYRASSFTFHRKGGGIYHFDGEPIKLGETVTVQNMPGGLKILVP